MMQFRCRTLGMLALMSILTLGCQSPESVTCDNGTLCAVGFGCTPSGQCALPEQLGACEGKSDSDTCSLSLGDGFCDDGSCVVAQCGNGKIDISEACDDGNDIDDDECSNNCAAPNCGDGIEQAGEECDMGAANADDRACTARCMLASCGDGLLQVGTETCDAGLGLADDGACTLACESNICGDGKMWQGVEACDDGNATSGDGCREDCNKVELCGDAEIDSGESCDDGNANAVDGCDLCQVTAWSAEALLGGSATDTGLRSPSGIAVDSLGNIFVADQFNHRIRRVDRQSGVITTVVGTGVQGFSGDQGPATSAQLSFPDGVAVDGLGNLFVADRANNRIRRVDGQSGVITTVAGTGVYGYSSDGGPAISAALGSARGVTVDSGDNVFLYDGTSRIRRIDGQSGIITTVAGNGSYGYSGDGGPATSAQLLGPRSVALDGFGNLFLSDLSANRIRRVDAQTEIITTVLGSGTNSASGEGGPATSARIFTPWSTSVDGLGNIFVAATADERIRRVDAQTGVISTIAGSGLKGFSGDGGPGTAAQLNRPIGIALDSIGNVYFADSNNSCVRRVDAQTGIITTVAGTGTRGYSGDGGPASSAELWWPRGLAVDDAGNILIADTNNQRIRRMDAQTGVITTIAGNGGIGFSGDDGPATSAQLDTPTDIDVDDLGNLYIADTENHRVRRVDGQSGIITSVAGTGTMGYGGDDGPATSALLNRPRGIAVNSQNDLLVADSGNRRIRSVDAQTGVIVTVMGNGGLGTGGDFGQATNAQSTSPFGVAVDDLDNIFTVDFTNGRIRRTNALSGIIETVAGAIFPGGMGLAPKAHLAGAVGMAVSDSATFFAGGSSGTVQEFEHGEGRLKAVVARIENAAVATDDLARYRSNQFGNVYGVTLNAADNLLYLSETSSNRIHVVTIDDVDKGVLRSDPNTWTIAALAGEAGAAGFADGIALSAEFREPHGLYFNEATRQLYVADTGNHVIRVIDVDVGTVSTLFGTPQTLGFFGDGGDAGDALLYRPTTIAECSNGDFFIADTGSHHIRRVHAGTNTISTVIGVGIAASAGDGSPATTFPVDEPSGLACDNFGNLFVSSRTTIRLLPADDTGIVDGTGPVQTIYGAAPRDTFPASVTTCLTDIAVTNDNNGATMIQATDSCTGILLELTREVAL